MYLLRRVYKAKPMQARKVASLVRKQQDIYESVGRSAGTVYFNPGTVPGDVNTVALEWTQENLGSPFLSDPPIPKAAMQIGGKIRELIESQHIEFWELMTAVKMDSEA